MIHSHKCKLIQVFVLFCCMFHPPVFSQLKLPQIFGDHMVIQRGTEVTVWGMAQPGQHISVYFNNHKVSAVTTSSGQWLLKLPEMKAGGPFNMQISSDSEKIVLEDILIGEVWFASGQSNMEHQLNGWPWIPHSEIENYEDEIKNSNYPEIRMFNVPKLASPVEVNDLKKGAWEIPSTVTLPKFSAIPWFFAKKLYKKLGVPIGVIQSSWGGTAIAPWLDRNSLRSFENDYFVSQPHPKFNQDDWWLDMEGEWAKHLARRNQISYAELDRADELSSPEMQHVSWEKIPEINNLGGDLKNWVWLKRELILPEIDQRGNWTIQLGYLNRQAHIFINGTEIGYNLYPKKCVIQFSSSLLKEGKNIILIRLAHPWGKPQIEGDTFNLSNVYQEGKLDISEKWLALHPKQSILPVGKTNSDKATYLFNGMVSPLTKYAIRGFIWNQGGSDVSRPHFYENAFPALIKGWRERWKIPEAPFIFVQLSNYQADWKPERESFSRARLRLAQMSALELPNTSMVVSYDIGNPFDVHPANKQVFGHRMAIQALSKVYGFEMITDGPTYKFHEIKGDVLIVHFENGPIQHLKKSLKETFDCFEIAGIDGEYYPANIRFEKNRVFLSSTKVISPRYVRYAWSDNPQCNVYNSSGFPMIPFATEYQHNTKKY